MKKNSKALLFAVVMSGAIQAAPPATYNSGVGARSFGLANNFVALANDFTAIYWNPAGLAFTPFREVQVSFLGLKNDNATHMGGTATESSQQRVKISSAGWLRSIPTSKGGFSFALGFTSPVLVDEVVNYRGTDRYLGSDTTIGRDTKVTYGDVDRLSYGDLNTWSGGVGWQVAPGLGVGFSLGLVTGSEFRSIQTLVGYKFSNGDSSWENTDQEISIGYLGYDARIGVMFRANSIVTGGVRIDLPKHVLVSQREKVTDLVVDKVTTYEESNTLKAPASGAIGLAATLPFSTITTDLNVRSPLAGQRSNNPLGHWNMGAGIGLEIPARVMSSIFRAGYSWQQLELFNMAVTSISGAGSQSISVMRDRHLITAGMSLLLGSVVLEGGYGYSFWSFSTSSPNYANALSEEHELHRVMASVSLHY